MQALPISSTLFLIAAICNEYFLAAALSDDGRIDSGSTLFVIRVFQLAACLTGAAILSFRCKNGSVLAKCLLATAVLCGVLSVSECLLFAFKIAPVIRVGWRGVCPAAEKNDLGFRGHPVDYEEHDFVVVLLGDSQVEAKACAYGLMPETQLEQCLQSRIDHAIVVSLGAGGYGQDQQLLALREYFDRGFRADLVILWQTIDNDVWNNTFPTHWPTNANPKPTFSLVGEKLRLAPELLETYRPSDLQLLRLWGNLRFRRLDDFWGKSVLPDPYRPLSDRSLPQRDDWQVSFTSRVESGDNFENDKNHLSLFLVPRSPRVDYGIQLTRALITEIEAESNSHGASLVLFRTSDTKKLSQLAEPDRYFWTDDGVYHFSREQYDKSVAEITDGFVSLSVPVTFEPAAVGPTDSHLNEHATAQVMKDLGNLLVDEEWVRRRGRATQD